MCALTPLPRFPPLSAHPTAPHFCLQSLPLLSITTTTHDRNFAVTSTAPRAACIILLLLTATTHTITHHRTPLQVIEKAYKKLRLDALVIQQGRLTENSATKVRA